jgi:hypothetical protein
MARSVPDDVRVRLVTWRRFFNLFACLHYALGIGGVLSSALAAGIPKDRAAFVTGFAVLSACCFAVIGFVAPEKRYLGFVRAWRTLDVASTKYQEGLIELPALLDLMARCETIATEPSIHDVSLDRLGL